MRDATLGFDFCHASRVTHHVSLIIHHASLLRMTQAQVARHRRHLQAARTISQFAASRSVHSVALALDLNPEIGFDRTAKAGHIDIGVETRRKHHRDVSAYGRELHVVRALELIDLDFDIAAHRGSADGSRYVVYASVTADG